MKQLECATQPPTKQELKASMKQRAAYGMIASFAILPLIMSNKDEAKDLDEIMNTQGDAPGYTNELYKNIMMKRIPMYDKLGLLDL